MMKESTMVRKLAVLAVAVLMAFMFCAVDTFAAAEPLPAKVGPAKDGTEVDAENSAINLVNDQKAGKYKLINSEKLKAWIDSNKSMVIIDTMPESSYTTGNGHIPGAKNAVTEMDKVTKAEGKALLKAAGKNKKKTIVVYCGFTSCRRSHQAAAYLVKKGYKKVYRQVGGIRAWKDAGYPVEGGAAQTTPEAPAASTATPAA